MQYIYTFGGDIYIRDSASSVWRLMNSSCSWSYEGVGKPKFLSKVENLVEFKSYMEWSKAINAVAKAGIWPLETSEGCDRQRKHIEVF